MCHKFYSGSFVNENYKKKFFAIKVKSEFVFIRSAGNMAFRNLIPLDFQTEVGVGEKTITKFMYINISYII